MPEETPSLWNSSDAYDRYMGRWSRKVAPLFLDWLDAPAEKAWVDIGCGSGGITHQIAVRCSPSRILGIDSSDGFLESAKALVPSADFRVGSAVELELPDRSMDLAVSGLVLNFVPDSGKVISEMARIRLHGVIGHPVIVRARPHRDAPARRMDVIAGYGVAGRSRPQLDSASEPTGGGDGVVADEIIRAPVIANGVRGDTHSRNTIIRDLAVAGIKEPHRSGHVPVRGEIVTRNHDSGRGQNLDGLGTVVVGGLDGTVRHRSAADTVDSNGPRTRGDAKACTVERHTVRARTTHEDRRAPAHHVGIEHGVRSQGGAARRRPSRHA